MKAIEIRSELKWKTREFELAMEKGLPHADLIIMYRNLKELQYQLLHAEISEKDENQVSYPELDNIIR